jgi:hypothetical protein
LAADFTADFIVDFVTGEAFLTTAFGFPAFEGAGGLAEAGGLGVGLGLDFAGIFFCAPFAGAALRFMKAPLETLAYLRLRAGWPQTLTPTMEADSFT